MWIEFACPYCGEARGSNTYVDEEDEPRIERSECECGAHFLFDYAPAHQQMRESEFTESTVKDIQPTITLRSQYLIAQRFFR